MFWIYSEFDLRSFFLFFYFRNSSFELTWINRILSLLYSWRIAWEDFNSRKQFRTIIIISLIFIITIIIKERIPFILINFGTWFKFSNMEHDVFPLKALSVHYTNIDGDILQGTFLRSFNPNMRPFMFGRNIISVSTHHSWARNGYLFSTLRTHREGVPFVNDVADRVWRVVTVHCSMKQRNKMGLSCEVFLFILLNVASCSKLTCRVGVSRTLVRLRWQRTKSDRDFVCVRWGQRLCQICFI